MHMMETEANQSLRNNNDDDNENSANKKLNDNMKREDSDLSKKLEEENSGWHPVRYRIKDGKKFLVLGDYEMSTEEFIEMARPTMNQEEIEEVEQGRCGIDPDELPEEDALIFQVLRLIIFTTVLLYSCQVRKQSKSLKLLIYFFLWLIEKWKEVENLIRNRYFCVLISELLQIKNIKIAR